MISSEWYCVHVIAVYNYVIILTVGLFVFRFVDKAIKATVIGHLFGDESSLLNASIDTTIREDHTEPGTT